MTLREEFENEVKTTKGGISVLFEVSNQHYIEWLEGKVKTLSITDAGISLNEAKQLVAEEYDKRNWFCVQRDYEYGMGISKLISFEELMGRVAEVYKANGIMHENN